VPFYWQPDGQGNRHTHTHPFNGSFSGTTRVSRYQKGKPIWILLKQEAVSCSGISWAICKSASRSRQITTPAPHHSSFTGRMPFLPPNRQHQSTEGLNTWSGNDIVTIAKELHVAWCYSTNNSPFLPSYIVFITGTN